MNDEKHNLIINKYGRAKIKLIKEWEYEGREKESKDKIILTRAPTSVTMQWIYCLADYYQFNEKQA